MHNDEWAVKHFLYQYVWVNLSEYKALLLCTNHLENGRLRTSRRAYAKIIREITLKISYI